MRCEVEAAGFAGKCGDRLLDFRCMAMAAYIVGLEVIVHFREMIRLLSRTAGTGYTGFRIYHDGIDIDELILRQRRECQDTGRRIAACIADDLRVPDFFPVPLMIFQTYRLYFQGL